MNNSQDSTDGSESQIPPPSGPKPPPPPAPNTPSPSSAPTAPILATSEDRSGLVPPPPPPVGYFGDRPSPPVYPPESSKNEVFYTSNGRRIPCGGSLSANVADNINPASISSSEISEVVPEEDASGSGQPSMLASLLGSEFTDSGPSLSPGIASFEDLEFDDESQVEMRLTKVEKGGVGKYLVLLNHEGLNGFGHWHGISSLPKHVVFCHGKSHGCPFCLSNMKPSWMIYLPVIDLNSKSLCFYAISSDATFEHRLNSTKGGGAQQILQIFRAYKPLRYVTLSFSKLGKGLLVKKIETHEKHMPQDDRIKLLDEFCKENRYEILSEFMHVSSVDELCQDPDIIRMLELFGPE